MYIQQGDVLLKQAPLDYSPSQSMKKQKGDLVHKGENHYHRLKGGSFQILTSESEKVVIVKKPTKLVHEEHGSLDLPAGVFTVGIVQEYDHLSEEARAVID